MHPIFRFKSKVWKYPGFGGWHFVTINKKLTKVIRDSAPLTGGFGSIRVKVVLGKSEWETSIFPTKDKEFLLPVKSSVRKQENIKSGDAVEIKIILQ